MTATRREFLKHSLAGGSLVSLGLTVPNFLTRTALAAPNAAKAGARDTILVVVQLTGGNDGLNTVIPFKDEEYARLRPTLKQPVSQIKKVTDSIGLHPSMDGLAGLLEEHALCIVQGVGYPNPNRSHFRLALRGSRSPWRRSGPGILTSVSRPTMRVPPAAVSPSRSP